MNIERNKPGPKLKPFWSQVKKTDSCWLWTGTVNRDGYGVVHNNRNGLAHRFAWFTLGLGDIKGKVLMHTCDTPACVNPAHLRPGTHRENQLDKVAKKRHAVGVQQGNAKLNDEKVRDIRMGFIKGASKTELAEFYGVDITLITRVLARTAWKHVE